MLQAVGRPVGELAEIIRLFVDPAVRGTGLGRELLAVASAHAVATGLRPVLEVVDDAGPAIALYERSGWQLIGTGTATWTTLDGAYPGLRYYVSPEPGPDGGGACGLDGVGVGAGGVGTAAGQSPDHDAWLGLVELPAGGLLGAVAVAAQRG